MKELHWTEFRRWSENSFASIGEEPPEPSIRDIAFQLNSDSRLQQCQPIVVHRSGKSVACFEIEWQQASDGTHREEAVVHVGWATASDSGIRDDLFCGALMGILRRSVRGDYFYHGASSKYTNQQAVKHSCLAASIDVLDRLGSPLAVLPLPGSGDPAQWSEKQRERAEMEFCVGVRMALLLDPQEGSSLTFVSGQETTDLGALAAAVVVDASASGLGAKMQVFAEPLLSLEALDLLELSKLIAREPLPPFAVIVRQAEFEQTVRPALPRSKEGVLRVDLARLDAALESIEGLDPPWQRKAASQVMLDSLRQVDPQSLVWEAGKPSKLQIRAGSEVLLECPLPEVTKAAVETVRAWLGAIGTGFNDAAAALLSGRERFEYLPQDLASWSTQDQLGFARSRPGYFLARWEMLEDSDRRAVAKDLAIFEEPGRIPFPVLLAAADVASARFTSPVREVLTYWDEGALGPGPAEPPYTLELEWWINQSPYVLAAATGAEAASWLEWSVRKIENSSRLEPLALSALLNKATPEQREIIRERFQAEPIPEIQKANLQAFLLAGARPDPGIPNLPKYPDSRLLRLAWEAVKRTREKIELLGLTGLAHSWAYVGYRFQQPKQFTPPTLHVPTWDFFHDTVWVVNFRRWPDPAGHAAIHFDLWLQSYAQALDGVPLPKAQTECDALCQRALDAPRRPREGPGEWGLFAARINRLRRAWNLKECLLTGHAPEIGKLLGGVDEATLQLVWAGVATHDRRNQYSFAVRLGRRLHELDEPIRKRLLQSMPRELVVYVRKGEILEGPSAG
jgi:hypothetical protein